MHDLLKPRYEVIASYPGSNYAIGLILVEELPEYFSYQIDGRRYTTRLRDIDYPHIFRKMNWWEGRTAEEMPKKVKSLVDGEVYEIEEWDMGHMIGRVNKGDGGCCSLLTWRPEYSYVPVL